MEQEEAISTSLASSRRSLLFACPTSPRMYRLDSRIHQEGLVNPVRVQTRYLKLKHLECTRRLRNYEIRKSKCPIHTLGLKIREESFGFYWLQREIPSSSLCIEHLRGRLHRNQSSGNIFMLNQLSNSICKLDRDVDALT